jgi:ABC-type polysaccharide/polyol phosphate transport system ATPase subunit
MAVVLLADPDVLIIDEVLSVGDERFLRQSLERIAAFRARGGALILVSHDTRLLRDVCPHAVWLESGRERMQGPCEAVVQAYLRAQSDPDARGDEVSRS